MKVKVAEGVIDQNKSSLPEPVDIGARLARLEKGQSEAVNLTFN